MKKGYAVLKGNNYFLSLAELKALLPDEAKISYFTGVAIFTPFQDKLARRSARIKRNGELILISDNPKEINEIIRGKCFWIKEDIIMGSQRDEFKSLYHEAISGVKISKSCEKIDIIFTDGVIILGKTKDEIDSKSIINHNKKPYSQSGTMNAETSRLMVNLARPKRIVLDPFTGTGSILIEARWLNYNCIGIDIDKKMLDKARLNLNYFEYDCELILASATNIPLYNIDSIATDPPYGRSSKERGSNLFELYEKFFASSADSLRKNGYMVFATDSNFNFIDKLRENSFILRELHFLYSHKSLTRAIYVVQRR